ncbi:hypothetical protein KP509_27G029800 [Ceratopteris richardii]|uniref:Uncharacterized protein n=1 Tax=Ceratopteris richardii TaxID=49495 RepID=A0A8T2RF33_CERRI|nr:hypothetical protein KP509_27G029800 [Ceratopteris richardii]KAH7295039.1 hypothetical protein KP509_27G029800 [Ceratopteris richardii]
MALLRDEEALKDRVGHSKPDTSIDPTHSRFPHCIVWTPLPIVSWLAPFFGHVGVCREDGVILDFSGSYLVNVDNLAFGPTARYALLDENQCCFPPHLYGHTCEARFKHVEIGTATSWDDGLRSCMQTFQHKCYNLFVCNCHSFAANFLNRIAYQKCMKWNMIDIVYLILLRGQWVDKWSVARSMIPFTTVMCIGLLVAGWPFFVGWVIFELLLVCWFLFGTYVNKGLLEC